MREQIDTIPVNDAFLSDDECPFCFLERQAEQRTIRYVLGPGASYMEPDVRAATDKTGFCTHHMKTVYDFGNTLGSALVLQTHFAGLLEEFEAEAAGFEMPAKRSLIPRKKPVDRDTYWQRLAKRMDSCFICDRVDYHMERYLRTFFVMVKDPEFRSRVENCKGFCLRHFAKLLEAAEEKLPNSQREWFYENIFALEKKHLFRVKEDLDWLVAKYDYRNASADWKNSRDALPRTMQKLQGLHPADPPFKNE